MKTSMNRRTFLALPIAAVLPPTSRCAGCRKYSIPSARVRADMMRIASYGVSVSDYHIYICDACRLKNMPEILRDVKWIREQVRAENWPSPSTSTAKP